MPLLWLLAGGVAVGSFLSSNALAPSTSTTVVTDPSTAPPSPYQLSIYAGMALGIYWLYKKASRA